MGASRAAVPHGGDKWCFTLLALGHASGNCRDYRPDPGSRRVGKLHRNFFFLNGGEGDLQGWAASTNFARIVRFDLPATASRLQAGWGRDPHRAAPNPAAPPASPL